MGRRLSSVILAIAFLPALVLAACGDDEPATEGGSEEFNAEEYFGGKTIRFITSSDPGGGTDAQIRVLARYLPEYIPGNPDSQVSNQTPHIAGINFLWSSKPDGLTIGMTAASTMEFELFEDAQWNSAEFDYIGGMEAACGSVLLAKGDLGYNTIEDAAGADDPKLIALTSSANPGEIEPHDLGLMLIADYLDLPLEIRRVAESGQDAINLAMERGEVNLGRYGSSWCILPDTNPGWLEDGFLVPLLDVEPAGPDSVMPEAVEEAGRPPYIADVVTEEQFEEWRGLVAAPREGGNPIFLPPETPDEIVEVLRDAYDEMTQDPEFQQAMTDASGVDNVFTNGADYQTMVEENQKVMLDFAEGIQARKDELYAKYVN